jgi:hypothetical protein
MESSIWDLLQHSFKDFKLPNLMLWLFGSLIHYTDCLCSISRDGGAFANQLFVLTTHANFLSSWCMSVTVYEYSKLT